MFRNILRQNLIFRKFSLNLKQFSKIQYNFTSKNINSDKKVNNQEFYETQQDGIHIILEVQYDEKVFETDEQRISIKLINCKSYKEIMQIYNEQDAEKLTPEILTLFFYFSCNFRQNKFIDVKQELQEISKKIIVNLQDLEVTYFVSFIWSLGIFYYETQELFLGQAQKNIILDVIRQQFKLLKHNQVNFFNQASSLAFSFLQIFQNDKDTLKEILELLADICLVNKHRMELSELFNFVLIFQQTQHTNDQQIATFFDQILLKIEELQINEISKLIVYLDELQYEQKHPQIYQQFINQVEDFDLSLENACLLLVSQSNKKELNQQLLQNFVNSIITNKKEINITDYMNIWISVAKIKDKIQQEQLNDLIKCLKNQLFNSKIFKISDFLHYELVNIIVACSSMRLNDKEFIQMLIKSLHHQMDELDKDDLLNLSRSFVVYVKQFESFFITIHDKCLEKIDLFSQEDIQLLKQSFNKSKILFPNSKLVDVTLY